MAHPKPTKNQQYSDFDNSVDYRFAGTRTGSKTTAWTGARTTSWAWTTPGAATREGTASWERAATWTACPGTLSWTWKGATTIAASPASTARTRTALRTWGSSTSPVSRSRTSPERRRHLPSKRKLQPAVVLLLGLVVDVEPSSSAAATAAAAEAEPSLPQRRAVAHDDAEFSRAASVRGLGQSDTECESHEVSFTMELFS